MEVDESRYSETVRVFICKVAKSIDETTAMIKGVTLMELFRDIMMYPSTQTMGHANLTNRSHLDEGCVFWINPYYIQLLRDKGDCYQMIIADIEKKKMVLLTADFLGSDLMEYSCDSDVWEECSVIDLGRTGRRWEGGVLNGERYGYGKEYNDENNLVYEGFIYDNTRVCYGKEYRGIRGKKNGLMYEGCYVNGVRYGFGKSYNLNGAFEYGGKWLSNRPITRVYNTLRSGDDLVVSTLIETLVIAENSYNTESITRLHFSPLLVRLKSIKMGSGCFGYVREFVLDGLENLESVDIGDDCFVILNGSIDDIDDGICWITNCPNLRQFKTGYHSFRDYYQIELWNADSLQSLEFESRCFRRLEELHVESKERKRKDDDVLDLPSLQYIAFGDYSFTSCYFVQFESME